MTDFQKREIMKLRNNGIGYSRIASELGVSENTIKSFCRREKLKVETASSTVVLVKKKSGVVCENCGKSLLQIKGHRAERFCSTACRYAWWNAHREEVRKNSDAVYSIVCAGCGGTFESYGNRGRKYCSHDCYVTNRYNR